MIYRDKDELLNAEFKGVNREIAEKMISNIDGKYINLFTRDEMVSYIIHSHYERKK